MGIETDIQVQEAQKVPKKMNSRKVTPGHILIKMSKIKDNLKSSKRTFIRPSRTSSRNFAGQNGVA